MVDQTSDIVVVAKIKEYTLTEDEMKEAAAAGSARQIENTKAGYTDRWNPEGGPFQVHINGAMGELACARMIGLPWNGKGSPGDPDVGRDIEVRTSAWDGKDPYVTIKEKDKDYLRVCFIRGTNGTYSFGGWIHAGDAKKDKWFDRIDRYGHKIWHVPMECLQK